jgi:cell division protein FtsL
MLLFTHRIRGFRTLNIVFAAILLVLAIGVNLAKTVAGRERNEIGRVENDIGKEKARIRMLEAEVAHLEQPERLERLSRAYLAMAPVTARQEATTETLAEVAGRAPRPRPVSTGSVPTP